ncbi:cell division protein FtsN [Serratia sp. UGAL515B_01]|uniref:cell division protein FtsN n=1 Tax=Serratia sp. UGAL515B_01 TaxID=2986763 RepID=UPI00295399FF|nr:cell division protein FtsN [Serratia sp. UGAL515B_01]WON76849.1 cell division protein FtsN [Serratia sp. UGAL515B_01]
MAQKDYVGRGRSEAAQRKTTSRKRRSSPQVPKTMVTLAVAILVVFIGGLYFITHHQPDDKTIIPTHSSRSGNGLPPKPEERWRYIKELENRQISIPSPTEPNAGGESIAKPQLTDEQRQLLEQMQSDMQQRPTQLSEVPYNSSKQTHNAGDRQQPMQQQLQQPPAQQQVAQPRNPFNNGVSSQQHQQTVSQPKPQVIAPPEPIRQVEPKPELKPVVRQETKPEPKKEVKSQLKQEVKPEIAKQEAKPEQKQKWMVQCGSFRATEQAESVRAQLAFGGIESRITSSGGWNRVMLGPYNSRTAADKALAHLKGNGMSSCIPLAIGG